VTTRRWGLFDHNEAAEAATALLAGACVQEVRFQAMSWKFILGRPDNRRYREFHVYADCEVSADGLHFVDMERDIAAVMTLLHGLIGNVAQEVFALGPRHYRIAFDGKDLIVRDREKTVDNAMVVAESPGGPDIFCG
jgi:hypothetical protein